MNLNNIKNNKILVSSTDMDKRRFDINYSISALTLFIEFKYIFT